MRALSDYCTSNLRLPVLHCLLYAAQNHMAEADGPLVEKHVKALGAEVARFTRWQLGGAGSGTCGALEAEAEAVQPPSA